ncbi:hypothetical protein [Ensifer sp. SSB1]|uniref:putative PDDEXK endonuclease n=1 Tax=Ensifer sp. SSB1 TaxID=2795385 RepID=UPI001A61E843|nr:hypothetical protein [Ensifer sp. SSB1]MBK5571795.1 hypothetical protein [Ensifer sp. SSB1]
MSEATKPARTRSQIGKSNRAKGQDGERKIARILCDLLGLDIRRRVRNHADDSDLTGMPGWSIEVKHCQRPLIRTWWEQTVEQAKDGDIPVLFYRLPHKDWRAVVHVSTFTGGEAPAQFDFTVEMGVQAFAELWREVESKRILDRARAQHVAQSEKNLAVMAGQSVQ